ncbi:TIGR01777 family oxidoreductase [Paenibacillus gansuensis]|uniref:TIGR01777 family oxidoreductase n=1 Tax=Paenibacillus gansuensis TaxID=306542 RepID=A0ABW5P7E0_9BACL
MSGKIVLAGGSGFIGTYLADRFREQGSSVVVISRSAGDLGWDDHGKLAEVLNGADVLVNLAGKSVDCRYNDKNKRDILRSRTDTTRALGEAVLRCARPPKLWINSSTATIYRHAEDRPMTEENGEIGTGFSVSVAKAWEEAFFSFALPHTRKIALRISIVLGRGGVMKPLSRLTALGLGGTQGPGNQMFSWIHIEDLCRIICYVREREDLDGVFNAASPHPVMNREFMKQLRSACGRSFGLPMPVWLLEAGARLIRTETELILKSRWVTPERLLREGFSFRYGELREALEQIFE